ncbi:MAG TPA: permease prefix domain 1-containing protein [Verrucomicrobiae bacterium]|nr:permease prefix domain 1-containing protein [Verrucomicrobiae bacterium]
MFDLEKAVATWRQEMMRAGIQRPEVLDELESHLLEQAKDLIATGVPEAKAFQKAMEQLGNCTLLKQEFSKVYNEGLISPRNPVLLNLLAFWFALRGFETLLNARHFFAYTFSNILSFDLSSLKHSASATGWSLFLLLLAIGLYRRQNFWRYCVLLRSALVLMFSFVCYVRNPAALHLPHPVTPGYKVLYEVMCFQVPYDFFCAWLYLPYAVLIVAVYYLSRPHVRALFRPAAKLQNA